MAKLLKLFIYLFTFLEDVKKTRWGKESLHRILYFKVSHHQLIYTNLRRKPKLRFSLEGDDMIERSENRTIKILPKKTQACVLYLLSFTSAIYHQLLLVFHSF